MGPRDRCLRCTSIDVLHSYLALQSIFSIHSFGSIIMERREINQYALDSRRKFNPRKGDFGRDGIPGRT